MHEDNCCVSHVKSKAFPNRTLFTTQILRNLGVTGTLKAGELVTFNYASIPAQYYLVSYDDKTDTFVADYIRGTA
jgi:hypothetical protein